MERDEGIDRLASKEMARREAMKRAFEEAEHPPAGGPLLTISRDYFCGGGTVAKKLAAKLGWNLYDRELIESIAKDRKVEARAIEELDENVYQYIQDWANEIFLADYVGQTAYMKSLARILVSIVKEGNAIVIGRGAHLLIPRHKRLAVRLTAPLPWRVEAYMRRLDAPAEEAGAKIAAEDRRRREYITRNFHGDIDDPLSYDLVINTEGMDPSTIQQVIVAALRSRFDLTDSALTPIHRDKDSSL
ncbi:MAG: cytidylate kinase-like family protein [Candidatus Eisenbacteria bacterium]